jgi:hypothetical protein
VNQTSDRPGIGTANPRDLRFAGSSGDDFRIEFFDPLLQGTEWDRLIELHSESHVFQSSAWARVLNHSYGHQPIYIAAFDGPGARAAIPIMEVTSSLTGKRGVSLPFSDFCPPLLFSDLDPEAVFSSILELGRQRGWKSLLLRGSRHSSLESSASCYLHSIDLTRSETELLERCASSVRRAVRKAQHNGIEVERSTSREALLTFYRLHSRSRRRHGLPPQPWKFFERIHQEFMIPGNGSIFSAKVGSQTVAAAVFLSLNDKVLYKFAASDFSFQNLRPNNLLLWEAIRFYSKQGVRRLDLGRTDFRDQGLRRFKLGWGSTEELLPYHRYDFSQQRWSVEKPAERGIHEAIFRRMPLTVNRLAGALLYPHLD